MRHPCQHPGCTEMVDTRFFMCPRHWSALPNGIRTEVTAAFTARMNAVGVLTRMNNGGGEYTTKQKQDARAAYEVAQRAHERIKAAVVEMLEQNNG